MSNTNSFAVMLFVLVALVVTVVAFARLPHTPIEPRLIGTWQSDAERTVVEILEQRRLTEKQVAQLCEIYGKLRVTFRENGTFTSNFQGFVETERYQIMKRDGQCVTLRVVPSPGKKPELMDLLVNPDYRVEFDGPDAYWQTHADDSCREYFLRVR